jgi:hypothetical protein
VHVSHVSLPASLFCTALYLCSYNPTAMADVRCQEKSSGEANNSALAGSFVLSAVPMNYARLQIEDEY